MLAELSIIPLGGDSHLSERLAEVLKVVDESGLAYQLTPSGTCIEGQWDEVISVVRQCHTQARRTSSHVITLIKIEDEDGASNKLRRNVDSVEEKSGRNLKQA